MRGIVVREKIGLYMGCILMTAIFLVSYSYNGNNIAKPPQVAQGVMDLRNWDLAGRVLKIDGEWEFYWQQLLEPRDFRDGKQPSAVDYFTVPKMWNDYKSEESSAGAGYATYRLNIKFSEPAKYLTLKIPDVATAYKLYINGELMSSVGIVGQELAGSKPQYLPQIVSFYTDRHDIELIIQVSNFAHQKGGIKSSLQLALGQAGYKLRDKQMGFDLFILGIIFIMAVYHFGLYLLRRKDKPALYFGLFCLLIAIRAIVTGEILIMTIFPAIEWELLLKIEYLSYYLSVPVFVKFIYHLYASERSPNRSNYLMIASLVFSGVVMITPVKFFAKALTGYHVIAVVACLYVSIIVIRAVKSKQEGAGCFVVGIFIFLGTVVNDILFSAGIITTGEMVPVGLFIFIFFQALALSTRFSKAYATLEIVSTELGHSNEKLNHILESVMEGFFALDHEARFTYVNKEAECLLQKTQKALLGKIFWDEFPNGEESLLYQQYKKVITTKSPTYFEFFSDKLGLWLEVNAYPLQNGLSAFVRNIQERKQAEEKIREYTEILKEQVRLLDLDPDYTFERNLDGVIIFWNHGAELGYHWTKEEAVGQVAYQLLNTQFPQPLAEINEELMCNGRWMGELVQTKRDGNAVVVRSCCLLKRGVDGKPVGVLEFNKDITQQKNMEKEMAQLDRLKIIGQMAASMSHEVRNPMTTVRGFLQLLAKKERNAKYGEYYELMLSELDRANDILSEYLSVARPRDPDFKRQDLNKILIALAPLLQADAHKMNKVITFDLGTVPDRLLDGGEIRQLILNLCRNGLEAMKERGKIVKVATFLQGNEVILTITDEGSGVDKDMMGKLGTPFLSTKDKGTGLGLAVCYGIVVKHKAAIEVRTSPTGTTFLVKFR